MYPWLALWTNHRSLCLLLQFFHALDCNEAHSTARSGLYGPANARATTRGKEKCMVTR